MLQMFLQQFVPAMEQVLTLAVPLGILFAILRRLPLEKYRRNYNTAIHSGFPSPSWQLASARETP